jgi:hypothetical protein
VPLGDTVEFHIDVSKNAAKWGGMRFAQDIEARLECEFAEPALSTARGVLARIPDQSPRILRCVLHLAGGSLDRVFHFAEAARLDFRDVIYWAEYEEPDSPGASPRHVRDFHSPFE